MMKDMLSIKSWLSSARSVLLMVALGVGISLGMRLTTEILGPPSPSIGCVQVDYHCDRR